MTKNLSVTSETGFTKEKKCTFQNYDIFIDGIHIKVNINTGKIPNIPEPLTAPSIYQLK